LLRKNKPCKKRISIKKIVIKLNKAQIIRNRINISRTNVAPQTGKQNKKHEGGIKYDSAVKNLFLKDI